MHKMLIAFCSFFILSLQEIFFYLYTEQQGCSVALLNAKLFIYSTLFVVILFQSFGFIGDGIRTCLRYQSFWLLMLLISDIVYVSFQLQRVYYAVVLSGLVIALISALFWKFSTICIDRYDTIVKTIEKEGVVTLFYWFGAIILVSYMLFIALVCLDSLILGIITLVVLIAGQSILLLRKTREKSRSRRTYLIVENEDNSDNLLNEEAITADFKIIQRLVLYFEEDKPYLDKDIKLGDVAKQIYTNKAYLSRALNQRMFKNFSQFVNYYRVREACSLFLEDPLLSLNDMCYKSGFKNISSFINSFSLNLRYTPAEWCKEIRRKIQNNEEISIKDYFI